MSAPLRRIALTISKPASAVGITVPRRHASAAFAHMKVKKQNWVEVSNKALRIFVTLSIFWGCYTHRYREFRASIPHVSLCNPIIVQQNEIARENKFYSWVPGSHNIVALVVMTVVFPLWFHNTYKNELQTRDKKNGFKEGEREYL